MFKSLGVPELLIILLIVIMIFGVGKLPQVAQSLGKSIREFKKATTAEEQQDEAPVRRVKKTTRKTVEEEA